MNPKSLSISGEAYVFLGESPVELKAGIGISLLLASARAGCKYTYEIKEKNHILDIYIQKKSFALKAYVFLEIEFRVFDVKFSFRVELAAQLARGGITTAGIRKKIPVQGKSETSSFLEDYI